MESIYDDIYEDFFRKLPPKIKEFVEAAKDVYRKDMEAFILGRNSSANVELRHSEALGEAWEMFLNLVKVERLDIIDGVMNALRLRLDEECTKLYEELCDQQFQEQLLESGNNSDSDTEAIEQEVAPRLTFPAEDEGITKGPEQKDELPPGTLSGDDVPQKSSESRPEESPAVEYQEENQSNNSTEEDSLEVINNYAGQSHATNQEPSPAVVELSSILHLDEPRSSHIHFDSLPLWEQKAAAIDIGIYFDRSFLKIGKINSRTFNLQVLMILPSHIAFEENGVVIGEEAVAYQGAPNHLDLGLIVSSSELHELQVGTMTLKLTTENVLKSFFMKIKSDILSLTNARKIVNVVVSTPFATTSNERRRIKAAAKTGFKNVRVLSSLITCGVAYAAQHHLEEGVKAPKNVFIVQSLGQEFSLGVVEITPDFITTKSVVNSRNVQECLHYEFLCWHSELFAGHREEITRNEVLKAYQVAAKQLFDRNSAGKNASKEVVVIQSNPVLDPLYRSIFDSHEMVVVSIDDGPLLGACLLAQKETQVTNTIPVEMQVYDLSRTKLIIASKRPDQWSTFWDFSMIKQEIKSLEFYPREFFHQQITLSPGPAQFILNESLNPLIRSEEVAVFELEQWDNPAKRIVTVRCTTDEDGIFSLHVQAELLEAVATTVI